MRHHPEHPSVSSFTSPLSSSAMDDVCPQVTLTTVLSRRTPITLRGDGWLLVQPEPTWPELLKPQANT